MLHSSFEADITAYVNREGENELLVGVRDTKLFDKSHPVYQKMGATYPTGSNTDYLLGIWQDVYMLLCLRYGLRMYLYNRGR